MDSKFKLIVDSFGIDRFKFNEPIKSYTALSLGGPAKLFFIAYTTQELTVIINMCRELKLAFFLFGSGSKIMISEVGFDGLVIKNRTKNIKTISLKGKVTKFGIGVQEALIEVDSGISMSKIAQFLKSQNLLQEGFLGLPGTIGGNLFLSRFLQNIVKSIKVLDSSLEIDEIPADHLSLKKHIILSAVFRVKARK